MYLDGTIARRGAMSGRQIKFQSENVMADICLGIAIAGVNVLIVVAIVIAFL
jgi:hypothetical protein